MIQHSIDDLWLASYLISRGAKVAGVQVLPYSSGSRMRAVFQLQDVPEEAIEEYSSGDPPAPVHQMRTAMNELRDLMYRELERRNGRGGIKTMPNGGNGNGQRRRGAYETGTIRDRRD
jgi:hypothetical protein